MTAGRTRSRLRVRAAGPAQNLDPLLLHRIERCPRRRKFGRYGAGYAERADGDGAVHGIKTAYRHAADQRTALATDVADRNLGSMI